MNKRLAIILAGFAVALIVGGVVAFLLHLHQNGGTAPGGDHHSGSSIAVWVAVFTAVYVPLMVGAARRRRERKDREDKS